ncbi:hypothetical protein DFH08DRAFT_704267 [Mycena albidolilacea]|uniref:BTB domain-containing protein n=1 Tax=Mycena albidolilacea TaxID=1033008 RepID=A0AAD6ZUW1_9AGAR|nr:hypothetical protein DFH08DRAFT_704267 [Mycena albidolilacea]
MLESLDWDNVFNEFEYSTLHDVCNHLPTPPASHDGYPVVGIPDDGNMTVSVSTAFSSDAQQRPQPPDVVLMSKDSVYFYVHSDLLRDASDNRFHAMLPISPSEYGGRGEPSILNVPEPSPVLNLVLHAIYGISCAHYSPPFETLVDAVDSMPTYGINPRAMACPAFDTSLHTPLSYAPLFPLPLYTLAARYDLFDLAVPTSSHLLTFPLWRLTNEEVERIGAIYLKRQADRLFFLHFNRAEALKRILGPPPHPHPLTPTCDFQSQKVLGRAWGLAAAYLVWEVRPDMSINSLTSALRPLAEHLSCELCQNALADRVKDLIVQWSLVKVDSSYLVYDSRLTWLAANNLIMSCTRHNVAKPKQALL